MSRSLVDAPEDVAFDRPFEVAGFWICPPGADALPSGELGIELDPAGIFGSGLHPTTQLCLKRLVELPPTAAIFDVGSGTGILALAALRLGTGHAVMLDLDPRALEVSRANARRNGLLDRARFDLSPAGTEAEQFPLIISNMPSAHLVEVAPALVRSLASGGRLILSGVYDTQLEDVQNAFRSLGLRVGPRTSRDAWHCLEFWPSW